MSVLHAVVLGIVQGLSEFLPVSSSGHLILVPWLFGWNDFAANADAKKTFDVALHMGTFVGAVGYFARDLLRMERRLLGFLLLSAIPGGLVGALLESTVEDKLGAVWLIAVMLVAFGLVLLWADRLRGDRSFASFGVRDALLMGAAQAFALQPGVSRSGVTISMGRWLGFERDAAARLSFLMSLPIIGGAGLFSGLKVMSDGGIPPGFAGAFVWGTLASGVTGFAAVYGLLRLLRRRSFTPFVIYRVCAGLAVLAIYVMRARG